MIYPTVPNSAHRSHCDPIMLSMGIEHPAGGGNHSDTYSLVQMSCRVQRACRNNSANATIQSLYVPVYTTVPMQRYQCPCTIECMYVCLHTVIYEPCVCAPICTTHLIWHMHNKNKTVCIMPCNVFSSTSSFRCCVLCSCAMVS